MPIYDIGIIGGGAAGLSLSIQMAESGYSVILFEKEAYPFHRVCGEYISLESLGFLKKMGLDPDLMTASRINSLQVSGINGNMFRVQLPLGGFGMSRFLLDSKLVEIARNRGVMICENTKVTGVEFSGSHFTLHNTRGPASVARVVAGSFGKRSNLDIKWKREFATAAKNKLNNYIGVKYHVKTNHPVDTISMHVFRNGYCGLVKIEEDLYNLCYLTTAANLQEYDGDISKMEELLLSRNPRIAKIFAESTKCNEAPLAISQVSFERKSQVAQRILMIGDAAGMITPLCGNGISMALHSSKIAAEIIHSFLENKITREEMEEQYTRNWQKRFGPRLATGRKLQRLAMKKGMSDLFIYGGRILPGLMKWLIRQTHGQPF